MNFENFLYKQTLNESINDKGTFKAVFTGGTAGAGKSYVLSRISGGDVEPRLVNVDKFTEFLNIHDILSVYDKSKKLSYNQMVNYINGVLPLFIDTTAANKGILRKRVDIIKSLGYDVGLVFVETSLETSLKRAAKRTRQVSPDVVKEYYEKIQSFKEEIKNMFMTSVTINNDEGELTDDVIIKAYRKIASFYNGEIHNPIGKERKELMIKNNWKYLTDGIMTQKELYNTVSKWYRL